MRIGPELPAIRLRGLTTRVGRLRAVVRNRLIMMELVMARIRRVLTRSDFDVRESSIAGIGQGLFPRITVYRGDTVGPYTGDVLTDKEAEQDPYVSSLYNVWVCKDYWICGEGPEASYTRYINHSDEPNARLVISSRWKTVRIEALKRIWPGQEIFIDYGPEYWECVGIHKR